MGTEPIHRRLTKITLMTSGAALCVTLALVIGVAGVCGMWWVSTPVMVVCALDLGREMYSRAMPMLDFPPV